MSEICVTRPIFAKRDGEWAEGLITVFLPVFLERDPPSHSHWSCRIAIIWPGFICEKEHAGENGYQALELALRLVPSVIMATDDFHVGNLSLHNGDVILNSRSIREFFSARLIGDV